MNAESNLAPDISEAIAAVSDFQLSSAESLEQDYSVQEACQDCLDCSGSSCAGS
jgi:hypothetical protein